MSPSTLGGLVQQDFSAGEVRSVARHLIPANGMYRCENGLLDNDGSIYRRGGSVNLQTSGFGSTGHRFLWDGHLGPGGRTVFADTADFGVLDGSEGPVNLGGAGLSGPISAASLSGLLFIGGGTVYGGSRKTTAYSTGTVTVTNGSAVVTGSGTSWSANVDAGMLFLVGAARLYVVASVDSNTQITLADAYEGTTGAGTSYSLNTVIAAPAVYKTANTYTVAGERLIAFIGDAVWFSEYRNPHSFGATSTHKFPGSPQVLGGWGIDNVLNVFTTSGMFQINNMEQERVDDFGNPQQSVQQVSEELILWSQNGIATWLNMMIIPAVDGIWLIGGGKFEKISKPIAREYQDYVKQGYHLGQATVFNGHYLMPVLDASENIVEHHVCRIDRPVKVRGETTYPWTRITGAGANVTALAVRVNTGLARQPKLLGASRAIDGADPEGVIELTNFFSPSSAVKYDHDGTVALWSLETRDIPTGRNVKNLVKRIRLLFSMVDAASDNPLVSAHFSSGAAQQSGSFFGSSYFGSAFFTSDLGAEFYSLSGTAPENDGRTPYVWSLRRPEARTRYVRFLFSCAYPTAELIVRSIETIIRPSRRI